MLKKIAKSLLNASRRIRAMIGWQAIYVYTDGGPEAYQSLGRKIDFYFNRPSVPVVRVSSMSFQWLYRRGPILCHLKDDRRPWQFRAHDGVFDVNEKTNPMEAWRWFEAEVYLHGAPSIEMAHARYNRWKNSLSPSAEKSYIFGTGPSLESARDKDWSDGIRIVCNTIVRDDTLWHGINPHAIIAADALYHFGYTAFAKAFRQDLHLRLKESPNVVFAYPDIFHSLIAREYADLDPERLIPIRTGARITIHDCIRADFSLPALGNALNKMLLPIACDLTKHVGLWGFDGRAPDDKLFWSNSQKHSYTELMHTLQEAHPAFFDHFVPKDDPESYVRSVHGDVLEYILSEAEKAGWTFEMLHKSWTPTLAKRMRTAA